MSNIWKRINKLTQKPETLKIQDKDQFDNNHLVLSFQRLWEICKGKLPSMDKCKAMDNGKWDIPDAMDILLNEIIRRNPDSHNEEDKKSIAYSTALSTLKEYENKIELLEDLLTKREADLKKTIKLKVIADKDKEIELLNERISKLQNLYDGAKAKVLATESTIIQLTKQIIKDEQESSM